MTTGPIYNDPSTKVDRWVVTIANLSTCPIKTTIKLLAICPPGTKTVECREVCVGPWGSAEVKMKAPCYPTQAIIIEHDHGYCDIMYAIKGTETNHCYGNDTLVVCYPFKDLVHLNCKCPKDDGWMDKENNEKLYMSSRYSEEDLRIDEDIDI